MLNKETVQYTSTCKLSINAFDLQTRVPNIKLCSWLAAKHSKRLLYGYYCSYSTGGKMLPLQIDVNNT